jgi:hypothetical protein
MDSSLKPGHANPKPTNSPSARLAGPGLALPLLW